MPIIGAGVIRERGSATTYTEEQGGPRFTKAFFSSGLRFEGITEGDATETFNLIKSMLQTPALIDIATQLRASRALAAKQVSDFIKRARKVLWY